MAIGIIASVVAALTVATDAFLPGAEHRRIYSWRLRISDPDDRIQSTSWAVLPTAHNVLEIDNYHVTWNKLDSDQIVEIPAIVQKSVVFNRQQSFISYRRLLLRFKFDDGKKAFKDIVLPDMRTVSNKDFSGIISLHTTAGTEIVLSGFELKTGGKGEFKKNFPVHE